jgi:ribonuclease P protein component
MRRASEFREVIASGQRVRRGTVVVHHRAGGPLAGDPVESADALGGAADATVAAAEMQPRTDVAIVAPIVGLVVGRGVGASVIRHQVSRRLRAQLAIRLAELPASSATVVRALPPAARADSATLGADLDAALARLRSGSRSPARHR